MKYITKRSEPASFTDWKNILCDGWAPGWDNLLNPQKRSVLQALLTEQGFICCYCGMGIDDNSGHIEHLKPRDRFPHLELEYDNLLASCEGTTRSGIARDNHCGHRKGDWYDDSLFISPLDPVCEDCFVFTSAGEILATVDPDLTDRAQETIDKLGLNVDRLKRMRREALEGIFTGFGDLTNYEINRLISKFSEKTSDGKFTPFCFVVVNVLRKYVDS
jgi:uncharacterized protein (TIGR02646 family)